MKKLLAVVAIAAPTLAVIPTSSASAASTTTFQTPGTYTYTVPSDAFALQILVAGSSGSLVSSGAGFVSGVPGAGAEMSGVLPVAPGTTLTIDVGGFGSQQGLEPGGDDGIQYVGNYGNSAGPGGGGASDIRGWVIAGGGGAAGGGENGGTPGNGGNAGLVGSPGTGGSTCPTLGGGGGGATAVSGGSGGTACTGGFAGNAGSSGAGGRGGDAGALIGAGGGGGGGGFYGGGGGGGSGFASTSPASSGGGGGGSSWTAAAVVSSALAGLNPSSGFVTITPVSAGGIQQLPAANRASSTCETSGGTVITDSVNEGVHTFLYTYAPSPSSLDVCFRAEDGTTGVGGMVSITPTTPGVSVTGLVPATVTVPPVGTPSTDGNSAYCATPPSTYPANHVPGVHPISTGTLPGGTTWMFDAYSDGASSSWVCVRVGADVNVRVVVPIQAPSVTPPTIGTPSVSVTPGYDVTFVPDPGTP